MNAPTMSRETASQTAGPYVHIGLAPKAAGFEIFENNFGNVLVSPQTQGERIRIEGVVIDGSGTLVRDVLIESRTAGRTEHYLPVAISGETPGEVRRLAIAGHDGERLTI